MIGHTTYSVQQSTINRVHVEEWPGPWSSMSHNFVECRIEYYSPLYSKRISRRPGSTLCHSRNHALEFMIGVHFQFLSLFYSKSISSNERAKTMHPLSLYPNFIVPFPQLLFFFCPFFLFPPFYFLLFLNEKLRTSSPKFPSPPSVFDFFPLRFLSQIGLLT